MRLFDYIESVRGFGLHFQRGPDRFVVSLTFCHEGHSFPVLRDADGIRALGRGPTIWASLKSLAESVRGQKLRVDDLQAPAFIRRRPFLAPKDLTL